MHAGIQKFVVEYNGMYIQAVHPDTFELLLVPFRLMRMHGGVDAHDTIQSLRTAFAEFLDIKDNAFHGIRTKDCFLDISNNDIPAYFKLGTIQNVDDKEIHIVMLQRLPIANCGDGMSVNVKAARVGVQLHGLLTPEFRCSSHSVDGCWKRLARSETILLNKSSLCMKVSNLLYNILNSVARVKNNWIQAWLHLKWDMEFIWWPGVQHEWHILW